MNTTARTVLIACALAAVARTEPLTAQRALTRMPVRSVAPPGSSAVAPSGATAFGYEAVGGMVGSLAGFGLGYALVSDSCQADDLSCELRSAGIALALATGGAAAGTYCAGRTFDTEPSAIGAIVGAVAGAVAGIGAWHLVTEDLDVITSEAGAIITYSAAQGIVTALGSRIARYLSSR